ncbi:hypothetical protein C1D04_17760, partial [Acinetobacter baumannii]|uniref:hypothetical protein n=1 Tax=Acinetobacter baumannii TaxID=470 RepID=UPI0031FE7E1D|nr:hypothetical protein [Acinetobacter baumannii]
LLKRQPISNTFAFKFCDAEQKNKSIIDHRKRSIINIPMNATLFIFQQKWATSSDPFLEFNLI